MVTLGFLHSFAICWPLLHCFPLFSSSVFIRVSCVFLCTFWRSEGSPMWPERSAHCWNWLLPDIPAPRRPPELPSACEGRECFFTWGLFFYSVDLDLMERAEAVLHVHTFCSDRQLLCILLQVYCKICYNPEKRGKWQIFNEDSPSLNYLFYYCKKVFIVGEWTSWSEDLVCSVVIGQTVTVYCWINQQLLLTFDVFFYSIFIQLKVLVWI